MNLSEPITLHTYLCLDGLWRTRCAEHMARGADVAEAATVDAEPFADSEPEPNPAPPQGESLPARLQVRLWDLIAVVRAMTGEYGSLTGDYSTPREVCHGLEEMVRKVKVNQEGWD